MGEAGIGKEAWSKTPFHHFLERRIDYCESLGSNEWMHYFVARYCAGSHAGIRASPDTVTSQCLPFLQLRVIIQSIRVSITTIPGNFTERLKFEMKGKFAASAKHFIKLNSEVGLNHLALIGFRSFRTLKVIE